MASFGERICQVLYEPHGIGWVSVFCLNIMYKHILSVDTTAFLCIQYDFASRKHLGEKGRLEM